MVKTLRFMMIALLAMVCNSVMADAYKTLTFPDGNSGPIGSYTKTWTATIGTDTWNIENFNNNNNAWSYIKCGRKDYASVATITTGFKIDKKISTVVVTIDNVTANKVNKIQLVSATDENFGDIIGGCTVESVKAGELLLKLDADGGQLAAGLYYKLVFDCAAGTANGLIQISKIQYFEEGNEPEIIDISNTPETAYSVAKALELIKAGEGLTEVYVKGFITAIEEVSTQYGNATYRIGDTKVDENTLKVFRGYYIDGEKFTNEDQIKVGDEVVVYGQLIEYKKDDTVIPELAQGNKLYSINGQTSGIGAITANGGNKVIYNLNGQRLQKMQKGINIVNGKKVIVK